MIENTHERVIPMSRARAGEILESLGTPYDEFWHTDMVPPITLDQGLHVGSHGGHGPIRYVVAAHRPHRLVRFEFSPGLGLVGYHQLEVRPGPCTGDGVDPDAPETVLFRHTIRAQTLGLSRLLWPILIRPIHDGAMEDMLDHVERSRTGTAHRQQHTTSRVRAMGRAMT